MFARAARCVGLALLAFCSLALAEAKPTLEQFIIAEAPIEGSAA
jgi:hypothetical protein